MDLSDWYSQARPQDAITSNPNYSQVYQTSFGGQRPQADYSIGAPQYTMGGIATNLTSMFDNSPFRHQATGVLQQAPDPALQATIQSMGAGGIDRGVAAFLGGAYSPFSTNGAGYGDDATGGMGTTTTDFNSLINLAHQVGYDTSKYNLDPNQTNPAANDPRATRNGDMGINGLYDDMNQYLSNYYGVGGLSSGWDGSKSPLSAAHTLYQDVGGGNLVAASQPVHYQATPNQGWLKSDQGRDMLSAASIVMPAFGGWAGLLGQGTAGTLSAGSGLGLTTGLSGAIGTGATNALVNAGINSALQGTGSQGFLGSLAGSLGGAAGNSLFGNGNGLSSLFSTANAGASPLNPMSYMNNAMNYTGLSNSPLGLAQGLFGAMGSGGINANTLRTAAGSLAGSYLGNQINPGLGGLGAQAGRGLASMYNNMQMQGTGA